jgi:predicted nucleotidyltransferase
MSHPSEKIVRVYQDYLGDNLISLVLFGSRARGEAREVSDYDIFVVAKNLPENPLERVQFLHRPEIVIKEGISVIGKTPEEFEAYLASLYLDLALDGIILCDKGRYIARKLQRILELINEAGLHRIKIDGELMWVWDRPVRPGWELEWGGLVEVSG